MQFAFVTSLILGSIFWTTSVFWALYASSTPGYCDHFQWNDPGIILHLVSLGVALSCFAIAPIFRWNSIQSFNKKKSKRPYYFYNH